MYVLKKATLTTTQPTSTAYSPITNIDAVLICSTHDTHADIAIKACAAGKHIFAEKPLAMTLDEARRVQKAVHESGVQLMSGWWFKHSPVTKRLREVIPQPYYTLFTCRVSYDKPNDPEGPYGRDGILDNSGYNLHWIWHVMRSQPVEIFCHGLRRSTDKHQHNHCSLRQRRDRDLCLQHRRQWRRAPQTLRRSLGWAHKCSNSSLRKPHIPRD